MSTRAIVALLAAAAAIVALARRRQALELPVADAGSWSAIPAPTAQ